MRKRSSPASGEPKSGNQELTELSSEIARKIGPIVQGETRKQVVERVTAILKQEIFQGPLPHPRHLEAYEKIQPGAADRIISMAERSLAFEISEAEADRGERRLGMWLGFAAFSLLVSGTALCAVVDQPYLGSLFLATGVLSVVGKFIIARRASPRPGS